MAFDQFPIRDSIGMMAIPDDLDDRVAALLNKIDRVQSSVQNQKTDSFSLKSATIQPQGQGKSILADQLARTSVSKQNTDFDIAEQYQKIQLELSTTKRELDNAKFEIQGLLLYQDEKNQLETEFNERNESLQLTLDEKSFKIDQLQEEVNNFKSENQQILKCLQELKFENTSLKDMIKFQQEQIQEKDIPLIQEQQIDTQEIEDMIRQRFQSEQRLKDMETQSRILSLENEVLELKNKLAEQEIKTQEEEENRQNDAEAQKLKAYMQQQEELKQKQIALQKQQEKIKSDRQAKLALRQQQEALELLKQQEQYDRELEAEEKQRNSQQLSLSLQDDDNIDFNATAQHMPQVSQNTSYMPDSVMSAHNSPLNNISMHQRGDSILEENNLDISKPLTLVKPRSKFAKTDPRESQVSQQNSQLSFTDRSFTVDMEHKTPQSLIKQRQQDFVQNQMARARSGPKQQQVQHINNSQIEIPPSFYAPSNNFNNSTQIKQIIANILLKGEPNYLRRIQTIDDLTGVSGHLIVVLKDSDRMSFHSVCRIDESGDLVKISGPEQMPMRLGAFLVEKFMKYNTAAKKFEVLSQKAFSQGVSAITLAVKKNKK
eukprot:EST41499.1 Microtubule-binding calmodulin-regulated spectrin-associated domain-containing protein [Spironucleus salmonicida]